MIIPDRKKAVGLIVSRIGKTGTVTDAPPAPEGEGGGDLEALAGDLISAIDSKSASAVVDAFRALYLACDGEPGGEGEGEG